MLHIFVVLVSGQLTIKLNFPPIDLKKQISDLSTGEIWKGSIQLRAARSFMSSAWKDSSVEVTGLSVTFKDPSSGDILCRLPAECVRSLTMDNNPMDNAKKERELVLSFNPSQSPLMFISKAISISEPVGPLTSSSTISISLTIPQIPGSLSGWLPQFVPFFTALKDLNDEIDITLVSAYGDIPFRSSHTDYGMTSVGIRFPYE